MTRDDIQARFQTYILEKGHQPPSVYAFAKEIGLDEATFYESYNSFSQIESDIVKSTIRQTIEQIRSEEIYQNYSVREKLLSFYYTWIEILKSQRSYFLVASTTWDKPLPVRKNLVLVDASLAYKDFAQELLLEGRETREVEQRPIPQIMAKYPDLLWMMTIGIFEFWLTDHSKSFEKTDTLIEKSVNTVFDWMGKSPLDSLFDLSKFLFQNRP